MSSSECEVEASGLCDAGRLIDDENVVRGAAVAVPFRLSGTEVHFAGRADELYCIALVYSSLLKY